MTSATIAVEPPAFSIGRVISLTFSVLGRHFPFFLLAGFLVSLPSQAFAVLFLRMGVEAARQRTALNGGYWAYFALFVLLGVALGFILQAVLTFATVVDLNGRKVSATEAFSSVLRIFPPLMILGLLYFLGIAAGFVALVVPGLMLLAAWAVVVPVRLIEKTGILDALSRSAELTKGHRWAVLGLLLIFGLIGGVLSLVTRPLFSPAMILRVAGQPWLYVVLLSAVAAISAAITSTGTACLYFVLRTAKEGIAPEQLATVFD